jgi:hypothetical protein
MKYCPNCGQHIHIREDNAAFCPGCGSRLHTRLDPHEAEKAETFRSLAKGLRIVFLMFVCLGLLVNIGIVSLVLSGFLLPVSVFLSVCLSLIFLAFLGAIQLRILGVVFADETINGARFLNLMFKTFRRLPLLLRPVSKSEQSTK